MGVVGPPTIITRINVAKIQVEDLGKNIISSLFRSLIMSIRNKLSFYGSIKRFMSRNYTISNPLEQYSSQGKIAYAHVRNVRGKVPKFSTLKEADTEKNLSL
ncbi:hypothetical protein LBYZC6_22760 [Lacrimispora brassicae]